MADIRSVFIDMEKGIDYALDALGLVEDDGLDSAVIISLFTDRRALDDDVIPDGTTERRGWWGDQYSDVESDRIGSRLWLLDRSKQLPEVMAQAKSYCQEALQWLVEDGAAKSVNVTVTNPRDGVLYAQMDIIKPDGSTTQYKLNKFWSSY